MIKVVDKLKKISANLRWLTRAGGLAKSVNHTNDRIEVLEQSLALIQSSLDKLHRIENSRCIAFGHPMQVDPEDQVITTHLSKRGCFEPFETRVVQQLVKPGQTVIDIGANIGYYTLQFAKLVGPTGQVYAFEPDPSNFELLNRNVAQNGYANVITIQKAIGHQTGSIKLYQNPSNRGDHRVYQSDESRDSFDVQSISLDDYATEIHRPIDVIKLDIQGFEGFAFEGMKKLLDENRDIKIITEFWPRGLKMSGHEPRGFLEELIDQGFDVQVIDEESQSLKALDIEFVLKRFPTEPQTDIFFTNLYCQRRAA